MYDVTRGLQKNGQFLLNTIFDADELEKFMPNKVKRYFAQNNITVYTINATKIAQEIGLGNRTNTILQSAFFRITGVIPVELAEQVRYIDIGRHPHGARQDGRGGESAEECAAGDEAGDVSDAGVLASGATV